MGTVRVPHSICTERRDVSVEELEQHLETGHFEEYGVPRATDDNGDWLDWGYALMHGTRKLSCGHLFSDYNIPLHGATINVLRERTEPFDQDAWDALKAAWVTVFIGTDRH